MKLAINSCRPKPMPTERPPKTIVSAEVKAEVVAAIRMPMPMMA